MYYKLLNSVRIGRELYEVNLKEVEVENGLNRFVLGDPYVYVELPPKGKVSDVEKEYMDKTNPLVPLANWEKTIDEWLANGIIEEAPDYKSEPVKKPTPKKVEKPEVKDEKTE